MGVPIWKRLMYAIFGKANREDAYAKGYDYVTDELSKPSTARLSRARMTQLLHEANIYARSDSQTLQARAEGMHAALAERGARKR